MPPWEKYGQSQPAASGPWSRYGNPSSDGVATSEPPPEPMTDRESFESSLPVRMLRGVEGPAITLMKMVGPDSIKKQLAEIDTLRESGMKKRGNEGFDWGGLAGALVPGGAIASGVTKALPSATTAVGKMLTGAAAGGASAAAQPLPGDNELSMDKVKQAATGAAFGGALPAVTHAVKSFFGSNKLNPTQMATLEEGKKAGYSVPPSMVNPSGLNNMMESIAGKAAVGQEAASRHQKITNAMTAKALGLPSSTTITPGVLRSLRDEAGKVYGEVEDVSPVAKTALRELRDARHASTKHFDHYFRSKDPDALDKAEYHKGLAELFSNELESEASKAGRGDLVKALAAARTKIAKTYDVEKALTEADSNVSAKTIGKMFDDKGSKAMTGELSTIGKMAGAFPSVMRDGAGVPPAGVSGTDAAMSAMLATLGYGAAGPVGTMAAAAPLMRPIARNLVLSPTYQKHLAEGIPARYMPIIDALTNQAAGAAGTAAGRSQ